MDFLKNVSDELWLGIVLVLVSIWILFLSSKYAIIAGVFAIIGLFFVVIDQSHKVKEEEQEKAKKQTKKVVKK